MLKTAPIAKARLVFPVRIQPRFAVHGSRLLKMCLALRPFFLTLKGLV